VYIVCFDINKQLDATITIY